MRRHWYIGFLKDCLVNFTTWYKYKKYKKTYSCWHTLYACTQDKKNIQKDPSSIYKLTEMHSGDYVINPTFFI